MAQKQYRSEEIIGKLREAEVLLSQGVNVEEVCRKIEVTKVTFYRWRREYGRLRVDQALRLKEVEREQPAEEAGGGPVAGCPDFEGGSLGKLLSPAKRRRTVERVVVDLHVSERRVCRTLGKSRSTQR